MTKCELVVMWITILVIVAMCVYPPYRESWHSLGGGWRTGYDWAWDCEEVGLGKLLVQCGVVAVVGGAIIFTMRQLRKSKQKDEGEA